MKGKILITFFVALFLLAIVPYETIQATSSTYEIDFESCIADSPITYSQTTYIMTKKKSGYVNASSSVPKTGLTDLGIYSIGGIGGSGWINLSYDKSVYLTSFRIWLRATYSVSSTEFYMIMYNKTTQWSKLSSALSPNTTNSILTFMASYSGTGLGSAISGNYIAGSSKLWSIYNQINISITDSLGHGTLWRNNSTPVTFTCSNSTAINNDCRIDSIYFYSTDWHSVNYIDDINLTLSTSYEPSYSGGCGYDLSSYQKIGIDNTPQTVDINGYQLMKIYNVYSNGYLMGVSLCVSPSQYAYDSNLANYTCSLLGFDLGGADCFSQDGFMYRLFWSANINLGTPTSENQQSGYLLYAQFFHTKKLWGNTYWQVCMGSYESDLDSDGNTYFKYGSTMGVPQTRYERDLGVSFYLLGGLHNASYGFTDRLGLHNYVGSNSTGFQYTLGQPEGIVCSYLLGNGAYSYRLEIYKNLTTLVKTEYNLQFPSGVIGYIPVTIGRYTFKLYNYHYTYNITAYVSGTLPDFFITTNPLMTSPFQSYDIFYKFYHAQGNRGIIGLFHEQSDCNNFLNAFQHIDIANNITTSTPYSSTATENEYLTLFINNSQKSPVAYTTHIIKNPNVAENYIIASSENIEITEGNQEGANITIYGTHLFPLCDIGIYIDGALKKSVKYEQVFNYDYVPLIGGLHNVSLRVMMNGTLVTLDYCMITVTIITPDEGEGGGGDLGGLLPPPYSYIMGAILTIVIMVLPTIALGKIGMAQSETLKYVPVFSGSLGFILCCLIGFFPWYSIFALSFILIMIIVVLYLSKKKE